jgi:hypothetical protein
MMQLLFFILIGILTMLAMEFQINVLAAGRLDHYILAVVLYSLLLFLFYFIGKLIDRRFSPKMADVAYYLMAGLFGLIVVE